MATDIIRGSSDGGFTLVEVLVALLILALSASAAFTLISASQARLARARKEQGAIMLANSTLAQIGHVIAIRPGHMAGRQGDFIWTVEIGNPLPDPPAAQGLAAYPLHVIVSWRDDEGPQTFTLQSVGLGGDNAGL